MKWNWGKSIVLAFVLFCGFISSIVVAAFQQDFDLVSVTYYQDELVYQERIQEHINLAQSGAKVSITQEGRSVVFSFPQEFSGAKGEIHFYHPSRSIFDRSFSISLNEKRQQTIFGEELTKGRYKVKLTWTSGGVDYFQEEGIFIR